MRGRLGSLYELSINTGIWLSSGLGLVLDRRPTEDWRWISVACAGAPLLQAAATVFIPETPYWLLKNGASSRVFVFSDWLGPSGITVESGYIIHPRTGPKWLI